MAYRLSTCTVGLATALLTAATAAAQVVDFNRYPDFSGQWDRIGRPNNWRDLSGPPPLTPEYQKVFDKSIADQRAGKPGNWPSTYCMPEGMPALMNLYNQMEMVIAPDTTYLITSHNNDVYRRIYTDGRDWPADAERTLVGYSIGKWVDENGDGKYTRLDVETRFLRGPRAYEVSGIPFHDDNQTIIKERFYLDKADRNTLYDDILVLDHAMTRPYGKLAKMIRNPDSQPVWRVETCPLDNVWVKVGNEAYIVNGVDGKLMPVFKDQPPPDLSYFKRTRQ
ncbi:MAG TPA: hypothetical protein VH684_26430 [Xanthobacteraceae bacterium]